VQGVGSSNLLAPTISRCKQQPRAAIAAVFASAIRNAITRTALAASEQSDEAQRLEDAAWVPSEKFDAHQATTRKHCRFRIPG
jgi:hypothetical protein